MDDVKQKVFIVDDEPANVLIIETAVETLGTVISTSESHRAIKLIEQHRPDVILLDINMPQLTGFDICTILKSDPSLKDTPVIFITSFNDAENERKALQLGAIDFISKPVDVELCRTRVKNQLLIQKQKREVARVNKKVSEEKERLDITLKSIADGVVAIDVKGKVNYINPVAQRLTGFSEAEATGVHIDKVMQLADATTSEPLANPALFALKLKHPVGMAYNAKLISQHGKEFRVEDTASPIYDDGGELKGAVIVFQDVSEAVAMAVQMTHLTNHDQLTGLPNRLLLHDRLVQSINRSRVVNKSVALLLIDIDNFKYLNDGLGHEIGDAIITSVASRLQQACGTSITLARVGGDEFACLLVDIDSSFSAESTAMACLQHVREPIHTAGHQHQVTLSIGISLYPQDASSAEEMMRHADSAMYRSKSTGKDKFSFFSKDLHFAMQSRTKTEAKLRKAIKENALTLFYQPKYDLNTMQIIGAECLVRLIDADGSVIPPDEFIPLAEETGLIHELGAQVMRKACDFIRSSEREGRPIKLAVNVSAQQIANQAFADEVEDIIRASEIDPSLLELEVTESALMADFEEIKDMLTALKRLGLSLALDDFGTGYSSLSYLRRFPLQVLKIDKSFVQDMDTDSQAFDIVNAIVRLALSLNLALVAEGIETEQHLTALKELGCFTGQGYLMCRPLAENAFLRKYLSEQSSTTV